VRGRVRKGGDQHVRGCCFFDAPGNEPLDPATRLALSDDAFRDITPRAHGLPPAALRAIQEMADSAWTLAGLPPVGTPSDGDDLDVPRRLTLTVFPVAGCRTRAGLPRADAPQPGCALRLPLEPGQRREVRRSDSAGDRVGANSPVQIPGNRPELVRRNGSHSDTPPLQETCRSFGRSRHRPVSMRDGLVIPGLQLDEHILACGFS
jgi:hypothetical protein